MTLQQIAHIKTHYQGLKMVKDCTGMFDNKNWAAVFEINFLSSGKLRSLFDYIEKENLLASIHHGKLSIQ